MTWLLAWTIVAWECPVLLGFAPAAVKPLVCKPNLRPQVYITEDPQGVQEKLEELGQGVPSTLWTVTFETDGRMIRRQVTPKWRAYVE